VAQDYKYNGKEEQTELGLGWLDYGARMYMPEIGRFNRLDRASGLFVGISPYAYALNNPSCAIDVGGDFVIFVNGLTNIMGIPIMPRGQAYWGPGTVSSFTKLFNGRDNADKETTEFVNGEFVDSNGNSDGSWESTAGQRYKSGRDWAIENYNEIIRKFEAEKETNPAATLNIVSHSQGAAFAEGIASVISEKSNGAYQVNTSVHLQPSSALFIPRGANTVDTRIAVHI
jgi:RHS repeat-associated protein